MGASFEGSERAERAERALRTSIGGYRESLTVAGTDTEELGRPIVSASDSVEAPTKPENSAAIINIRPLPIEISSLSRALLPIETK